MKAVASALVVIGLISLVTSAFWSRIAPQPPAEPEEKIEEFTQAVSDLHGGGDQLSEEERERAKAVIEEVRIKSEKAQRSQEVGATVLRYGGILMALIGGGLLFYVRQSEA